LQERALHALRARPPGRIKLAATQLHDQIIDVSAGQVLNSERAEFTLDRLQDVFVARCGRRPDFVTGL
jgi:hypothetical protein